LSVECSSAPETTPSLQGYPTVNSRTIAIENVFMLFLPNDNDHAVAAM